MTRRHSLSLTMNNSSATQTKSNGEEEVFPCDEEQLCGAEDIICWEAQSIDNDEEELCGAEEIKCPEDTFCP